jgi:hypothetical protein
MHEINFIDKSFSKDAAADYCLSLQASQNGLIYCIFDKQSGRYNLFRKIRFEDVQLTENLTDQFAERLKNDDILDLPFCAVRFLGYTRQSTLVPAAFFDRSTMKDFLAINQAGEIDGELFSSFIASPGIYNVFALSHDMVSLVSMHFKKVVFFNQTTPFLNHIGRENSMFTETAVHVSLNTGFFDVACTGDGNLKLYNTFPYVNESDLLYYVLYVCNQLRLDIQNIPLYLSGELSSKLSYLEILKQYIPGTSYAAVHGIPALAPALGQLNVVKFLNILNINTCEL